MPSPFPGMDPYLELRWPDVHGSLIYEGRRALNGSLPPDTVARSEQRIVIDDPDEPERLVIETRPDVDVVDERPADGDAGGVAIAPVAAAVVIDAPFKLLPPGPPAIQRSLRISDLGGRLLTVIEVVSPSNKQQPGLAAFQRNRSALVAAGVNVVEIDLVRAGSWRALMAPDACPPRAASTYRAVVRTAGNGGSAYLFPMPLRQPLPDVPVPVRSGEPPTMLPLQAMVAAVYASGRYDRPSTYVRPLDPPLDPDDAAWAAALLAARPR